MHNRPDRSERSLRRLTGLLMLGLCLSVGSVPLMAQSWEPVGPDLEQLDVSARRLYFHPHGDHGRFFVLGKALLQLDDGGRTWQRMKVPPDQDPSFDLPSFSQTLAIDPLDPARFLWILNDRLLKTENQGRTWNQFRIYGINTFLEAHFNPRDPSVAYVVGYTTEDVDRFLSGYRSLDGGETWKRWSPIGTLQYLFLSFAPHNPNRLYIGGGGLYRSSNGGENWQTLLPFDFNGLRYNVADLAFGGPDDQTLYVVANSKLLKSSDGGATFETPAGAVGLSLDLVEGDPRDDRVLFVRTMADEILRSIDGGTSFQPLQTGLPTGVEVRDLKLEPRFGNDLYVLTPQQLYRWPLEATSPPRTCRGCPSPPFATAARTPTTTTRSQTTSVTTPASSPAAQLVPRTTDWTPLGPQGGPIANLAVCPSHNETVYAAAQHHVFVSRDSAQSWQLGGVLPTGQILELNCDADDADRIYVDGGQDGLWRSDDAGLAWRLLTSGLGDPPAGTEVDVSDRFPLPQRLAVHPHLGGTLYLAAGNVYRSLDAGDTWTQVYEGEPPFCQLSLPTDGSTVLARPCALDQPVADRQFGLWRSDDGGNSWQQLRSDPLGPRLFTDPVDAERIAATGYLKPLLESFDGQRWYPRGQGLPAQRLRALAVHPLEPHVRLAAAADQLLRSENDGVSYTRVDDPDLDARELHAVRYAPGLTAEGSGPRAYLATNTGVLRTRGGGVLWTPMDAGLQAWPVEELTPHPSVAGHLLLVAGGRGWRSLDGGNNWQRLNEPSAGNTLSLAAAPSDPQVLYAGGPLNIWRSDNGGATWLEPTNFQAFLPLSLAVDATDPMSVYVAGQDIFDYDFPSSSLFKSTDGGTTWTSVSASHQPPAFYRVAVDPSDPTRLYAAGPGLFRSAPGKWEPIAGTEFRGPTTFDFAFDPSQPGTLYAATLEDGVLRAGSTGVATATGNQGLPPGPVRSITVANDGTIYAGMDTGIYQSTDGGDSWQPLPAGAHGALSRGITQLVTDGTGRLYAGTADHGVHSLH